MTIDLTQIIQVLITLICGLVARYLIPWIKSKLDDRQYDVFYTMVRVGVFAAEQLFNSEQGKEKKEYVLHLLEENGYQVDEPAVDAVIEAVVKELKIEMEKKQALDA